MFTSSSLSRCITIICTMATAAFAGCASTPGENAVGAFQAEPVVLTYGTGSLLAKRDKRPTTEEEKQRAQEEVDSIRSSGRTFDRNGR
jgi:hypothetical protein